MNFEFDSLQFPSVQTVIESKQRHEEFTEEKCQKQTFQDDHFLNNNNNTRLKKQPINEGKRQNK